MFCFFYCVLVLTNCGKSGIYITFVYEVIENKHVFGKTFAEFCCLLAFCPKRRLCTTHTMPNAKFAVVVRHQNLHEKRLLGTKRFSILYIVKKYTLFI